jgi:hypothetical protein
MNNVNAYPYFISFFFVQDILFYLFVFVYTYFFIRNGKYHKKFTQLRGLVSNMCEVIQHNNIGFEGNIISY